MIICDVEGLNGEANDALANALERYNDDCRLVQLMPCTTGHRVWFIGMEKDGLGLHDIPEPVIAWGLFASGHVSPMIQNQAGYAAFAAADGYDEGETAGALWMVMTADGAPSADVVRDRFDRLRDHLRRQEEARKARAEKSKAAIP